MNLSRSRSLLFDLSAGLLLLLMAILAGGAALRESVTIDEVAHIGAGLSYVQKLDLRLNEEHPPLAKALTGISLVLGGTHANYSHVSWTASRKFLPDSFLGEWVFGEWVLEHWNNPVKTLAMARFPMLILTLLLGWVIYVYGKTLGGNWGGLLCLALYVSTPVFLTFGPLVLTDVAVTLFSILALRWFAETWQEPSRENVLRFALYFSGALLSKFSAGLLFFAFGFFALSTRLRPVPGQPQPKEEERAWRRLRWRATWKGIFVAAVIVYVVYFVFSWNQTTDVLYLIGHSSAWVPVRRLLMPPWLYLRGILMLAVSFSRPAYILGQRYPHGALLFFPALFVLKSTLGFLGVILSALGLSWMVKPGSSASAPIVPSEKRVQWRVLWVALVVFVFFSVVGHFDVSYRHFTIPLVLLTLLLAPVPRMLNLLSAKSRLAGRCMMVATALLVASSLFTAIRTYPYFFPYMNAFRMGRPQYALASDSNVDWNQALPEVKRWADQRGIRRLPVDFYGFSDPVPTVPQGELWNCQRPTAADDGQWVVVSADMILDTHNCGWLLQYPHEELAAGGMYAFRLPTPVPPPGSPGGPPLPAMHREFVGFPVDMRVTFLELVRNPETLPKMAAEMETQMSEQMKARRSASGSAK